MAGKYQTAEEWRKQKSGGSGTGGGKATSARGTSSGQYQTAEEWAQNKYSQDVLGGVVTQANNWIDRYNKVITGFSDYDKKRNGGFSKDVGGGYGEEIDALIRDFGGFQDYLGVLGISDAQRYVSDLRKLQKEINDGNQFMGQFDGEDDYNQYLTDQEEAQRRQGLWFNQTDRLEEQKRKTQYKTGDGSVPAAQVEQNISDLQDQIRKIDSRLAMSENSYLGMPMSKAEKQELINQRSELAEELAQAMEQGNYREEDVLNQRLKDASWKRGKLDGLMNGGYAANPYVQGNWEVAEDYRDSVNRQQQIIDSYSPSESEQRVSAIQEEIQKVDAQLARGENAYLGMSLSKEEKQALIDKRAALAEELAQATEMGNHRDEDVLNQRLQDQTWEIAKREGLMNSGYAANPYAYGNQGFATNYKEATDRQGQLYREKEDLDYYKKYVDKTYQDNFFGQFGANYSMGRMGQDSSLAWNEYLDNPTEENRRRAETIDQLMTRFQGNNTETLDDDGTLTMVSKDLANYIPQLVDQIKYEAAGALVALPTVLIPGVGGKGVKAAVTAASGIYSYQTMRGAAFKGLLEAGADEETAKNAAHNEAVISSMIEMAETAVSLVLTGGGAAIDAVTAGKATALKEILEKTAGKNVATRFMSWAFGYFANIISEGLEEGTQESVSIANENDPNAGMLGLAKNAWDVFWDSATNKDSENRDRVMEASEGGARLAIMMGGAEAGTNAVITKAATSFNANRIYGDDPQALVSEALEINPDSKLAKNLQAKLDAGKKITGSELAKLVGENEVTIKKQDLSAVEAGAKERLAALGETENVDAVAQAVSREVAGEDLTWAQKRALEKSKYGQRVLNELNPENIKSGDTSSDWTRGLKTNRLNSDVYAGVGTLKADTSQAAPEPQNKGGQGELAIQKLQGKEINAAVSEDGMTRIISTGENANIKGIKSIKNGNITFEMEDGSLVDAGDISYGSEGEAILYDTVASLGAIPQMADELVKGFSTSSGISPEVYAKGIQDAFRYGQWGVPMQEVKNGVFAGQLTEHQRKLAYDFGRLTEKEKVRAKQEQRKQEASQKNSQKEPGKVHYDGDRTKLTKAQQTNLKALDVISDTLGVQIYVFESETAPSADGKGTVRLGANGRYDASDGSIHIDLYAGADGKGTMLFTAAHELTHFIRDQSPEKFQALSDFLMEQYGKKGISIQELVENQMAKAKKAGHEIDYDGAFEEVVADSMENMLTDGKVLQELKQQNKGLWQTVKDYVLELCEKIRKVYESLKPDSREGRLVAEMLDSAEEMRRLFTEGLVDAGENFRGAEKNITLEGDVKMQIREIGNTGKFYVRADRQVLTGTDTKAWEKQIANYINETIRKEQDVAIPTADGHVLLLTGRSSYKLSDQNVASIVKKVNAVLDSDAYALKGRTATHIDELIQVARFQDYKRDIGQKHENDIGEDGFNYYEANFMDFDGKYYRVRFSAGINGNEETAYSIGQIRERRFPTGGGSSSNEALKNGRKPSDNAIIYTSEGKSQVKNAIVEAYERALEKKNSESKEKFSLRDQDVQKLNAALEKQNEKLREDVVSLKELLRLQKSVTGGKLYTDSSLTNTAKYLMENSGVKGDVKAFKGLLRDVYDYIASGEEITWDRIMERSEGAAQWLEEHMEQKHRRDPYADEVLKEIRGGSFYLDEQQKQEAVYRYGSVNDYRKGLFGRLNVSENARMSLDEWWAEKSQQYPDIFDPEISSSDMPVALIDAMDSLKNMEISDQFYDQQGLHQGLLQQIYDGYWRLSTLYTVADVKQKQINRLKGEHIARLDKVRTQNRENIQKLKAEHRVEIEKVRADLRKNADERVKAVRKQYQDSRKKSVDGRKRTEMRHKLQKDVKELDKLLNRGTKERNVKEGMRDFATEAIATAEVLFSDEYSDEDMVRNGVLCEVDSRESRLLDETRGLLREYNDSFIGAYGSREVENIIVGDTESFDTRMKKAEKLKQKISENMRQLKGVFERERNRLNKATVSSMLDNLAKAYKNLGDSDEAYIRGAVQEEVYQHLLELSRSIGGTIVKDMDLEQLTQMHEAYTMVLTTIRNANKAFKMSKSATIQELSEKVMTEVSRFGGNRQISLPALEAIKKFGFNNLKPVYAFELMGSDTFKEIFKNVRKGEDTWIVDVNEARDFRLEQMEKFGYNQWDMDNRQEFTSATGKKFKLNLPQMMSLYAYSRRKQAADHIRKGGIVFDENTEISKKTKLGITMKFNPADATAYNISDETMAEIVGKLTKKQRGYVEAMQKYLSEIMGEKGNEVSLQMYGIKLFGEEFYFPLRSAEQYMERAREQKQGDKKIKNAGFSKQTVENASSPVVLSGFDDLWADHVNEMSVYHAFVLPMEDFYRVWNYKTGITDDKQTRSVNAVVQNAYGKAATDYVDQLLKDLNGGARMDPTTGLISKGMNLFKKGAVFASASVVIQQPSAIGRAFSMVDPKYFIGPKITKENHKIAWEQVKKYAPIAAIKEMGYFDVNMGKSTTDYILGQEYEGFGEKTKAFFKDSGYRDEALSRGAALADEITWCSMWEAVKRETKAKHPGMDIRSEAFLQLAGERFTDVIVKTQVYDSVLSRSGNMRSKDTGMKMVTAFMAEPTTSMNMVVDALVQGKRGGVEGRRYCRRMIAAVAAAQFINSVLVSFVYAARDDDEDETYFEKYVEAFTGAILDSLNPATYLPVMKDIMSIFQGYDVERSDMAVVSDLWKSYKRLSSKNLSTWRKVEDFAGSWAQLFGVPLKNVMRDARALYQMVESIVGPEKTTLAGLKYAAQSGAGKEVSQYEQMFQAYMRGDEKHLERVVDRFMRNSDAPNDRRKELELESGFESYLKKQFLDEKVTEEEVKGILHGYLDMDASEVEAALNKWKGEAETGKTESDMADDYLRKTISGEAYMDYLQKYSGKTQEQAEKAELKLRCERDEWIAYSEIKGLYMDGELTGDRAATIMATYDEEVSKADAKRKLLEYDFESAYGIAYSDRKRAFLDGEISKTDLLTGLQKYGGYDREDAEEYVEKLVFEDKHGFAYSEKKSAYLGGEVSGSTLKNILITEMGYDEDKAELTIQAYDWQKSHPESKYETTTVMTYLKPLEGLGMSAKDCGISVDVFAKEKKYIASLKSDKDKDGKGIPYSRINKAFPYINKLPLSSEQKTALAVACGWELKTVNKKKLW